MKTSHMKVPRKAPLETPCISDVPQPINRVHHNIAIVTQPLTAFVLLREPASNCLRKISAENFCNYETFKCVS
jgi:hypothetical protein